MILTISSSFWKDTLAGVIDMEVMDSDASAHDNYDGCMDVTRNAIRGILSDFEEMKHQETTMQDVVGILRNLMSNMGVHTLEHVFV